MLTRLIGVATNLSWRDWVSVGGFVLSATGLLAGYLIYRASLRERVPVFLIDRDRVPVLDARTLAKSQIRVIRADGSEVTDDITAVRFFLWNAGRESIRPENILRSLQIRVASDRSEILDYRLIAQTRPDIVNFSLQRHDSRTLKVDFNILERGDGGTGIVFLSGTRNAELQLDGVVEGTSEVKGWVYARLQTMLRRLMLACIILALFFALPAIFGGQFDPARGFQRAIQQFGPTLGPIIASGVLLIGFLILTGSVWSFADDLINERSVVPAQLLEKGFDRPARHR